jgi:acetyl esterase
VPLDADAEKLLDLLRQQNAPAMETLSPEQARATSAAAMGLSADPGAEVASVEEREIGGVPSLVVTPMASGRIDSDLWPVLVWFHGGGWVIGSAELSLHTARDLAAGAGCVVVVPDYRLAPEHPFPAAFDDAVAVTRAVVDQADELGGDPSRVAVGGDSAGGNLAAVAAQWVAGLVHQLLAYPVIDATMTQPSYHRMERGYLLTASMMQWFVDCYVGNGDPDDPRISPLFAPDKVLRRTCPAHVVVAGYDPLCDEDQAYSDRLADLGVPTVVSRYDGQMHGFLTMGAALPTGAAALEEAIGHLRLAFAALPTS